jgi:hypothetical protein
MCPVAACAVRAPAPGLWGGLRTVQMGGLGRLHEQAGLPGTTAVVLHAPIGVVAEAAGPAQHPLRRGLGHRLLHSRISGHGCRGCKRSPCAVRWAADSPAGSGLASPMRRRVRSRVRRRTCSTRSAMCRAMALRRGRPAGTTAFSRAQACSVVCRTSRARSRSTSRSRRSVRAACSAMTALQRSCTLASWRHSAMYSCIRELMENS